MHDYPFTPIYSLRVVSKVDDGDCVAGEMPTREQEFQETWRAPPHDGFLARGDFRARARAYFAGIAKISLLTV